MPPEIEAIIYSYLESLEEYSNLPSLNSILRLVKKSDAFVMTCLGRVLNMRPLELSIWRYRILFSDDFSLYFRLGSLQKIRLMHLLEIGMTRNKPTTCLI